jgi:hypothetical protein
MGEQNTVLSTALTGLPIQWLHALPTEPNTTDVFAINEDNFAIKLIREILSGKNFALPIAANFPASHWINHFNWESKNRERVFGQKTFGFGYPFVFMNAKKDGSLPLVAPLFFWQINIEADAFKIDHWTMQRTDNQFIVPNYPLFNILKENFDIDLLEDARIFAENRPDGAKLGAFCSRFADILTLSDNGLPLSLTPFPTVEESPELISAGNIQWSGVLGILPSISRRANSLAVFSEIPTQYEGDLAKNQHSFGMLGVDSSQRSAMQAARTHKISVVEGASGTGKTQALANMVINALSNGQKCLVVSPSVNALRRSQNFLLLGKFGDLSFILRDEQADLPVLLDILRSSAENAQRQKSWDADNYKLVLTQTLRAQAKLDETHQALNAPIFEGLGWSEIVGRFLRANRLEGKEMLLSQLTPADFEFSEKEFQDGLAAISASQSLLYKSGNLRHPLGLLKNDLFLEKTAEKGQIQSEQWVTLMLDKARDLHHRFLVKSNDYAETLTEHYENHYLECTNLVAQIRDGVEDGVNSFGPDFEKPASVTEKLYGVFSEKYREMVAQKEKIGIAYDALKKAFLHRKYFDFEFPLRFDSANIKKVGELTTDFEVTLRHWRKRTAGNVRTDVSRLASKSTLFELDFGKQIEELELALEEFVKEFNESAVFEEKIAHQMLTIPKRQEFLETVIDKLETVRAGLKDWPDFYSWQTFWLAQTDPTRKMLRALIKIKPRNWAAAWESWFLHHLLQQEYTSNLTWDQSTVDALTSGRERLFDLLPAQISALWQGRKIKSLQKLKDKNDDAFKNWFGKNNKDGLGKLRLETLFAQNFEEMTETLPVLLTTPNVALDVIQANEAAFDWIFIDEAHNISIQEGLPLLKMGKKVVVFGDFKQDMTPNESDDLLEFCKKNNAHLTNLEYQHQDCPEEWVRFNRVAFDTPFKRLPKGHSAFDSTISEFVNGRYDAETHTNPAEAEQIIRWLNDIKPTPANTFPVVGIACATIEQRDLIAGSLLKIRQKRAAGFEKIHQMLLNGLTVCTFGELQGQHVDVLLCSFTHGSTGVNGVPTSDFAFWNTQKGLNQLHVLLTRASQKMFIAHSIPRNLSISKENRGTAILHYLVEYADFLQKVEPIEAEKSLEELAEMLEYQPDVAPPSLFLEEVETALLPYFEPSQIRRNADLVGVGVPLLIRSKTDKSHDDVLLFDGLMARSGAPAFLFERKLKNYFTKFDIELIPTWSVNWWKNPRQEARRLAGKIIRKEENSGSAS